MPDMVAIVSKAVYQRDMPAARVGDVLPLDAYLSTNAALKKLEAGGRLFLVTVRPPEALWLVAVLNEPKFDGSKWTAARNVTPVRDVSALRAVLRFENGKGLPAEAGKLGMALQTPRVLTVEDATALAGEAPPSLNLPTSSPPGALINLARHVTKGREPCLCKRCLPTAPREFELQGERFVRRSAVAKGRALHFWAPAAIADARGLTKSVAAAMRGVRTRSAREHAAPAPLRPAQDVAAPPPPQVAPQPRGIVGLIKRLVGK